jgi:ABC-2 type transport system permease protein
MARLIAGEFEKVFSTRLWLWLLITSMALTALYVFLGVAFSDNPDNPTPPLSSAQGQRTLLTQGASPAFTLLAVLAAIGMTGEFRYRTATPTFLATPRRGRVVTAKLVTYAIVGLAYAIVCTALTVAIAVPWLATMDIDVNLTDNGIPGALAGSVAAVAMFGLIGVGLGAVVRDQAAASVGLLVYLFVIETILTQIPEWNSWTRFLPGIAARSLTQVYRSGTDFLPAWQGGLILAGYGIGLGLLGAVVTSRRDVA